MQNLTRFEQPMRHIGFVPFKPLWIGLQKSALAMIYYYLNEYMLYNKALVAIRTDIINRNRETA